MTGVTTMQKQNRSPWEGATRQLQCVPLLILLRPCAVIPLIDRDRRREGPMERLNWKLPADVRVGFSLDGNALLASPI